MEATNPENEYSNIVWVILIIIMLVIISFDSVLLGECKEGPNVYNCHKQICADYNMVPFVLEEPTNESCAWSSFRFIDEPSGSYSYIDKTKMVKCWNPSDLTSTKTFAFKDIFDVCEVD